MLENVCNDKVGRVIVNTGAQYLRTILNVCLSLYSTRIILQALGASDYGIYTLVAGVVSLLSFIINAMAVTTQRYMSYYMGRRDTEKLKSIFNTSLFLHVSLGVVLAILLELVGSVIFDFFLNIATERLNAAKVVFHATSLILIISFISAPFRALLVARENIIYISIVDVLDGVLKLIIAFVVSSVLVDKLILYALLLIGITLFNLLAFAIYDICRYKECVVFSVRRISKQYIKELSSFVGWTTYSIGCIVGRTQGIALVINNFFGVIVNAAYGVALQINACFSFISNSLLNALNPQIVKAEGAGNRYQMLRLAEIESKFSFFLLSMVAIPCIFEMSAILEVWLQTVPEYSVYFCRYMLIALIVDQLTIGLGTANQAIGKIKVYSLIVNSIKLLTVVVVFMLLQWWEKDIRIVMWCFVFFEFICAVSRLLFLRATAGLSIQGFVKRVFLREIFPLLIMVISCWLVVEYIYIEYRFLVTFFFAIVMGGSAVLVCGLCEDERKVLKLFLGKYLNKKK